MRWMLAVAAVGTLAGCPADDASDVLDGEWRVAWSCTTGCSGPAVALTGATRLDVDGGSLVWNTSPISGMAGDRAEACIGIADGTPLPHPADRGWSVYDLEVCGDGVTLSADLYVIRSAGEVQEVWAMTGTRP